MKATIPPLILLLGSSTLVRGATVNAFWSAQTERDAIANGGAFDPNVTASTFPTAVSITMAGTHVLSGGSMPGGNPGFTDFQGNTWNGVQGATGAGFAFGWNGTSATGSDSLTLNLDLTNLRNLSLRMDVRSATGGSASRPASFQSIQYSIGGSSFTDVPGANLQSFTDNNYLAAVYDLSSLTAINGQSDVRIRFTVENTPSTTSFRFDNIQLTAETIPEPGSLASLALGAGFFLRRKRA